MSIKKKILIISAVIATGLIAFCAPGIREIFKALPIFRRPEIVKHFTFTGEGALREWDEKIFKGRVAYEVKKENDESFVLASSDKSASALYYRVKLRTDSSPFISWKWSSRKFPVKAGPENITDTAQDDFAARVYVIFPRFSYASSKVLEYVWAENVPEGTIETSPYSKNYKLIVVESGRKEQDGWVSECRDIKADYIKAFGEDPRSNVGAIAFMTDADVTESAAEARYDEIKIGYRKREGGAE